MFFAKSGLLRILFWFGAIATILTLVAVQVLPGLATMPEAPYYGAWQGIFWHRNHLGSIFALLNMVFLIQCAEALRKRQPIAALYGSFYLVSLVIVFFSRSATGAILVVGLNLAVVLAWTWIRLFPYLRKIHYAGLLGFASLFGAILFLRFDAFLGLFGRTSSFTGRVPLWNHLIQQFVMGRPWFGYGFGAFWTIEANRNGLRDWAGWLYPVVIGDNGFLDILLHVGLVGLGLFLVILIVAFIRAFRFSMKSKSLSGFFPLLFLLYAVVANFTFSLFLETETFIWILLVAVLFLTSGLADQELPSQPVTLAALL